MNLVSPLCQAHSGTEPSEEKLSILYIGKLVNMIEQKMNQTVIINYF